MPESAPAPSNATEISVSELAGALKRTLEDRFGLVRVRGEVSGYRGPHSSGHVYFSLKDANARLDAVIWKMAFQRMRVKPEEGLEVIATGRITTFPGKSSYQIIVESIEPAGVGALMALLEARRKALAAEGLFDETRKRALPYMPRVIGVITSPTGAVIRDILHRLADRFPIHVIVWPVRVQGDTAAAEVTRAIEGFNALPEGGRIARPDLLIVARGGGSLEDLWSFNEENVVRAAAGSAIPLIAAVGHETDWTLIDHAADRRAPTPTAAAEMSVPVRAELRARLADLEARLAGASLRGLQRRRDNLRALSRGLPAPERLLAPGRQRLDSAVSALRSQARKALDARKLRIADLSRGLQRHSPRAEAARAGERIRALGGRLGRAGAQMPRRFAEALERAGRGLAREARRAAVRREETRAQTLPALEARLTRAFAESLRGRRARLASTLQVFEAVNYTKVLARGFVLVHEGGADGPILRRAGEIKSGQSLSLQFADGHVSAATGGSSAPAPAPRAKRKRDDGGQTSLF